MSNAKTFGLVAKTVLKDNDIRIVVVSAGGKTEDCPKFTDALKLAYDKIKRGESVKKSLSLPFTRVRTLVKELRLNFDIDFELMKIENDLEKSCNAVAPDFLLSRGEYLYSKIFARYCSLPFIDAAELFKFDENGKFNAEFTRYLIKKACRQTERFVCGGFYGSDEEGRIRTFARGGSDYSGAVAAGAISADVYLNFTDVDGVYNFNPAICKQSKVIERLSYSEIRRLGEYGASVLQCDSVLPLEEKGIPIIIKNTFNQEAKGTEICKIPNGSAFAVAESDGYSYAKIKLNSNFSPDKIFMQGLKPVVAAFTGDYAECVISGEVGLFSESGVEGYFENSVTLFFATDCPKSLAFIKAVVGENLSMFGCKISDGYYLAVKTADKTKVELILTDFLKS